MRIKEEFLGKVTVFTPQNDTIKLNEATTKEDIEKCYAIKGNEKYFELVDEPTEQKGGDEDFEAMLQDLDVAIEAEPKTKTTRKTKATK